MTDVFISYARSTEPEARQIAETLRSLGYGVWRDDELPAHRAYAEVIEERLKAAKAVVVIWSADAVKSQWVQPEADPGAGMPFDFTQCADLTGWIGDPDAPGWRKPRLGPAGHPAISCHLDGRAGTIYLWGRRLIMAEPQLSVRSAKARDLAHRLARRERRSIADIVERALEAYEVREAGREPASLFYGRLASKYGTDIDLEAVIHEDRQVNAGPDL